jgi:hypothetical protein
VRDYHRFIQVQRSLPPPPMRRIYIKASDCLQITLT